MVQPVVTIMIISCVRISTSREMANFLCFPERCLKQARIGDPLVRRRAPSQYRSYGCDCDTDSNKVITLVADKLGPVVDITKGRGENVSSAS